MKIQKVTPVLFIPLFLFAWIWISRVPLSSMPTTIIEAPKANFLAPDFTLNSLDGEPVTLQELKGRPVILNFWASWCPPCRAEMPAFQLAWQEYMDTDLVILAVNATHQDTISEINQFIEQNNLEFAILLDMTGKVSSSYQIHSLPTTFLIDRDGIITKTIIGGPIPLALLRVHANQLLQEKTDVPSP